VIECQTPDGRFGFERLTALLGGVEATDAASVMGSVLEATVVGPGQLELRRRRRAVPARAG
jgi:hypothetical protein